MPDDRMTMREVELLQKADEIIERNKKARPDFRFMHGRYEERAIIYAAEFWRDEAARLAKAIHVSQQQSMSMGEPD